MANNKNNQLGLSGSSLYNWKAKPSQDGNPNYGQMQSLIANKGRQPSGASAPRDQYSDLYKTPGISNSAGVPKAPSLTSQAVGGQRNSENVVWNIPSKQESPPNKISGLYHAPGTSGAMNQAYDSYADQMRARGYSPISREDFSGSHKQGSQSDSITSVWGRNKDRDLDMNYAAGNPKHKWHNSAYADYLSVAELGGFAPMSEDQFNSTHKPPETPPANQNLELVNWNYKPAASLNPAATPAGVLNISQRTQFDSLPVGQRDAYISAMRGGRTTATPQQAYEYAQMNAWAGVPDSYKQKYESNFSSGNTSMSPQDAAKYYWDNTYQKNPEEHYLRNLQEPEQEATKQAQQYYDSTRQLARTNQPDYTGYNSQTELQNKRVAEDNARMDAMNAHLAAGGGLKYQQSSTGFGMPEQVAQSAANINALADYERGKKDAYNTQQDAVMDNFQKTIADSNKKMQYELGVGNPTQAKMDLNKLTARYNNHVRSPGGKGTKFVDFVQGLVNAGEIPENDDMLKIVGKNYNNHVFHGPSDEPLSDSPAYNPNVPSADELKRVRKFYRGEAADKAGVREENRERGLVNRKNRALLESKDREARAELIAQGYSPQQAGELVGRNNSIQNYYNTAIQQQALPAQIAANTERYKADAGVYSDMYKTDALVGDKRSERADAKEIRKYEQDKAKQAQDLEFAAQASAMHNGEDPYQVGTKANRDFENRRRVRDGRPPAPAPTIDRTMDKIKEDTSIDIKNPNAIASIHRKAEESNASEGEQLDIIGRSLGRDVKNPDEAVKVIEEMLRDVRSQAALAGAKNSGAFKSGDDAFYSTEDAAMATYGKTINLLAKSLPKDKLDAILSQHAKEMAGVRNSNSASTAEWAGNGLTWYKKYIDDAGSAAVGKLREIF